ncbi:hypothetical protein C4D60_Mb07t21980 [Musa balbisiana]|uniref:Tetraspanin family protein n=1 Tax=Musa balbisiana TaxID=52838 RepID=A0A4S8JH35_MUSBA|nr:hypothetical protein C4D60_Mb07t21980 [Musa balbisiana]
MRPSFCRSCLAFALKFLNFLQTFVGVSVLIYSIWVLNCWHRHGHLVLDLRDVPAPWFVCASMGVGISLCLISLTGYVAAEAVNGCCLCFVSCNWWVFMFSSPQFPSAVAFSIGHSLNSYAVLSTILIVLEAALMGDILLNKHWEEDLPYDSTGELKNLLEFVEDNMDIFKWVAVSVIAIQASFSLALCLLLTLILRALVQTRNDAYDSDEDFVVIRRPLLHPQGGGPSYGTTSIDNKGIHSDTWRSRMRHKYGLNQNELPPNAVDLKPTVP